MKKTCYCLEMMAIGNDALSVIKTYRDITGLGLKEAKDKVDSAPCVLLETTSLRDAENYKTALEASGAAIKISESITEISASKAKGIKKIGIGFIILNLIVIFGGSALLYGIGYFLSEWDFSCFFAFAILIAFGCFLPNINGNKYTDRMVDKTVRKNAAKHNFDRAHIFKTRNATIMIDAVEGRIAYISNLNPWKFQVISAKEIADIKADRTKDLFPDTTRYVYFQFSYQDKIIKIPTFTSRSYRPLTMDKVQEGLKNAATYAEILRAAKHAAVCKDTRM